MKYLPQSATVSKSTDSNGKDLYVYNVLEQFVGNLRASSATGDPSSAEFEMLQLLNQTSDKGYMGLFTARVNKYLGFIEDRLKGDKQAAMDDFALLAEGRRRLYRGREDGNGLRQDERSNQVRRAPHPESPS